MSGHRAPRTFRPLRIVEPDVVASGKHGNGRATRERAGGRGAGAADVSPALADRAGALVDERIGRGGDTETGTAAPYSGKVHRAAVPSFLAVAQAKLTVGASDDPFEREADRLAGEVVGKIRDGSATRRAGEAPDGAASGGVGAEPHGPLRVQRRTVAGDRGGALSGDAERSFQQARSGGQPMAPAQRAQMEHAFGADFGGVRLHAGAQASALSEQIDAQAFTVGSDIFFNGPAPSGNADGQQLLAHELAHTLQQGASTARRSPGESTNPVTTPSGGERIQRGKKRKKGGGGTAVLDRDEPENDEKEGADESSETESDDEKTEAQPGYLWSAATWVGSFFYSSGEKAEEEKEETQKKPAPQKTERKQPQPVRQATSLKGDDEKTEENSTPSPQQKIPTNASPKSSAVNNSPKAEVKGSAKPVSPTATAEKHAQPEPKQPVSKEKIATPSKRANQSTEQESKDESGANETQTEQKKPAKQQLTKKQIAAQKAESRLRNQQLDKERKAKAREKLEAAERKQEEDDKADYESKSADVELKVTQAVAGAKSRGIDAQALHQARQVLAGKLKAKKTSWAAVKSALGEVSVAADVVVKAIEDADATAKVGYDQLLAGAMQSANTAMQDGEPLSINIGPLRNKMQRLTDLQNADVKNWTLLKAAVEAVASEAQNVQSTIDSAEHHDANKDRVLALAAQAKVNGEQALQPGDGPPKSQAYWQPLRKAMTTLANEMQQYTALADLKPPNWDEASRLIGELESSAAWVDREIAVAPYRSEGRVPVNITRGVIEVQDADSIQGDGEHDEQQAVDDALDGLAGRGLWRGGAGGKWGTYFGDGRGDLPPGSYEEYYVEAPDGKGKGRRRLVKDTASKRVFYTWTHYGEQGSPAFVLLQQ